jgi:hypothetical protein
MTYYKIIKRQGNEFIEARAKLYSRKYATKIQKPFPDKPELNIEN